MNNPDEIDIDMDDENDEEMEEGRLITFISFKIKIFYVSYI